MTGIPYNISASLPQHEQASVTLSTYLSHELSIRHGGTTAGTTASVVFRALTFNCHTRFSFCQLTEISSLKIAVVNAFSLPQVSVCSVAHTLDDIVLTPWCQSRQVSLWQDG